MKHFKENGEFTCTMVEKKYLTPGKYVNKVPVESKLYLNLIITKILFIFNHQDKTFSRSTSLPLFSQITAHASSVHARALHEAEYPLEARMSY